MKPTPIHKTPSLHDALPICRQGRGLSLRPRAAVRAAVEHPGHRRTLRPVPGDRTGDLRRSEEHTSELQSRGHLVCRLLLEKYKKKENITISTRFNATSDIST